MCKTIFVGARKGGVGKTMTTASLGFGLVRAGKKVLCIDADSQHSLTVSFGVKEPDKLQTTLATVMTEIINERAIDPSTGILRHSEGVDFLPANNSLTGFELVLAGLIPPHRADSAGTPVERESILRQYVETVKPLYDYIIIDTAPTLDLLTVNALAVADSVVIPIAPKYLDAKGLELLLKSVAQIKRQINPVLTIGGILFTMVDRRSRLTREVISTIESVYGGHIKIFKEHIPNSVRCSESSANGVSIYQHDPGGKVAVAYSALVREVLTDG